MDDKSCVTNKTGKRRPSIAHSVSNIDETHQPRENEGMILPEAKKSKSDSKKSRLVKLFDLDLLKDWRFINLLLGISIAVFSEINFALLTPLILKDLGYNTEDTATFMSLLGLVDIMFRFLAPFIGDSINATAQPICVMSFIVAIMGRACK